MNNAQKNGVNMMAIYAISDLHLSLSSDKPMDVFGGVWENYVDKLKEEWEATVKEDDVVIVSGDVSWAMYLDEAVLDLQFIDALPGKKIISRGNHDYWWASLSKLESCLEVNNIKSISFVQNNAIEIENYVVCGCRGWKTPLDDDFKKQDQKIYNRELLRLEISLTEAIKTQKDIIVSLHYPPFSSKGIKTGFVDVLERFRVKYCIYGHLHSEGMKNAIVGNINDIEYILASSNHLLFKPRLVMEKV